jgi:hypothetical protein
MQTNGRSLSVLGSIRPKADPKIIEQIHQEEAAARQEQLLRAQALNNSMQNNSLDPNQRNLPGVGMSSVTPDGQNQMANNSNQNSFWPFNSDNSANTNALNMQTNNPINHPPQTSTNSAASYGNYNSPSMATGALIPPPPAVTLSTQAATMPYGAMPGGDPYANAYANPYMNPYMMAPPQAQNAAMSRPSGLFGSGTTSVNNENSDNEITYKSKKANIVVITPTGMESRSPYKQRDDLRMLWKGAIANSDILSDSKFTQSLNKVDVSLPQESSKGSISVQQRQVDNTFKSQSLDKHIQATAKRVQSELVQSYYRYLYAYNKYSLAQQNVAARKQEVEVAESAAEKQRAAADLSQAQNEAESSRDDLKASQNDLAAIAGAQSARTIISRVSGIAPNLDSLAQSDSPEPNNIKSKNNNNGFTGFIGSAFGLEKVKAITKKKTSRIKSKVMAQVKI